MRFFRDPATKAWKRFVDGRDTEGVGDRLFVRPLEWRPGVQVVAIYPWAAFRKPPRMWLHAPQFRSTRSTWCSSATTHLTQQVHGRGGRSIEPVWATRRLLLRAGDTLGPGRNRLSTVFATDDATGKLQAAWLVKEQLRTLLATGDGRAAQPETNRLWRMICQCWKEIEVLVVTGATMAKVQTTRPSSTSK